MGERVCVQTLLCVCVSESKLRGLWVLLLVAPASALDFVVRADAGALALLTVPLVALVLAQARAAAVAAVLLVLVVYALCNLMPVSHGHTVSSASQSPPWQSSQGIIEIIYL